MKSPAKYKVIGVMSGTSLDGLDLAYTEYTYSNKLWKFRLLASYTKKYSVLWKQKLAHAHQLSGEHLALLDNAYGLLIGKACKELISTHRIPQVDFIASHGHTVFHQPENRFTLQIGNGNAIHAATGLPVINDFRSLDVLRGGEGAPLVPMGDHLLFADYDICLNLGGIANLSLMKNGNPIAFDVCFANMGLNYLAGKLNKAFDRNGQEARKGKVDMRLLSRLNQYYTLQKKQKPSLGREGFEKWMQPLLDDESIAVSDRLRTWCEMIGNQIDRNVPLSKRKDRMLVTGGGALNHFLVSLLHTKLTAKAVLVIPDRSIIEFKEAIIFGLLGVLRIRKEVNILQSVTHATQDSCVGTLIGF